jgi:DNA-binding protein Fis
MSDFTSPELASIDNHDSIAERVSELLAEGNQDIFRIVIEPVEREVVRMVVEHCKGNYVHASRILGISRMTLRKKLGVTRPWGKRAAMATESSPRESERDMNPMQKSNGRQPDREMELVDARRGFSTAPYDMV